MSLLSQRSDFFTSLLLATLVLLAGTARAGAEDPESPFTRTTIDIGVVVSDVERSATFYTEVIGFTEITPFDVPADFATASGLTDNQPLHVRVFVLGEDAAATRLKLIQLPGVDSRQSDNTTIHAQLGFSYLTVHIQSTPDALARLEKAGVAVVAEGPVPLPEGLPQGISLTLVRDPDGNIVELVGPSE